MNVKTKINLNIPLIKASEKFRINLYKYRIKEFTPDIRQKIKNYTAMLI